MSKIGFVFSGEGARGSIQSGIVLALSKKGINADYTIGVSSGAICASGYSYLGPEGLADLWSNITSIWDVFGFNWNFLWNTGILNQKPAEKIIANAIKNDPIIECEAIVSRMNIDNGIIEYVSNKNVSKQEFGEAALGAFAIPGLVSDRNGYVDATFRVEAPLKQAIEAGCTEIYVILGRSIFSPPWKRPKRLLKSVFMLSRSFGLAMDELILRDVYNCIKKNTDPNFQNIPIHVYEPQEEPFKCLDFKQCPVGVQIGLQDHKEYTERALRMIFK
jgi:predicted acylesterase/phospholipase RssA